jgi:serine/threonine protein kinase
MENRIFLERYRLSLGRNGLPVELHRSPTARAYRAQEIESGREVALTLVAAPNDIALRERLESEATAAQEINQINIPRLYDFGRENGELIYVTEYCEGHTAAAWVAARGPLLIGAVLRLALQVVDAMNATAFQRLHHPALNPDNILFVAGQTTEGDWPPVKVLQWFAPAPDFSQMDDERIDSAARFAAPEQLSEGRVDVRAEIYSLGATIWFLLTGAPPASAAAGWAPAQGAENNLRGAPRIVRHLLDRMLSVNPDERPQDPVALASYLQTCLTRVDRRGKIERRLGLSLFARPRAAGTRTRPPIPIKPLAWAAGCLALVALAIVFLPWPLIPQRQPTASSAPRTVLLPKESPNDARLTKNSLSQSRSRSEASAPPTSVAATSQGAAKDDQEEQLASTAVGGPVPAASPVPVVRSVERPAASAAVVASGEPPTVAGPNGPSTAENNVEIVSSGATSPEPAAPGEGPVAAPAAARPARAARRSESEEPVSPSIVAETDEQSAEIVPPTPVASATPAAEEAAVASSERGATESKPDLTKRTARKREAASKSHSRETRPVAHQVKRARPLPKLRVGSSPAELVGTTSDGRWILSVAESGQRIIVPPPPGFGQ